MYVVMLAALWGRLSPVGAKVLGLFLSQLVQLLFGIF